MLKLLRRIPVFSKLKIKELKSIQKLARARDYGPGELIFSKADASKQLFIIHTGRVRIFAPSSGKKRKTFAYLGHGSFFGEMGILESKPRSASAEAVSYTRVLAIKKADFMKLLRQDPGLTFYLLKTVSERLRRTDDEIETLLFSNILGRVSKTLRDLSRTGVKSRGGILIKEHFSQQELADMVGTTREPVTRALSSLRRAQLLDLRDGRYFIKEPGKLEAMCLCAK